MCRYQDNGGKGGGALHLIVSGVLTHDGMITVNGGHGVNQCTSGYRSNYCCGSGGGSGGSLLIETGTLAGSGVFSARGEDVH